MTHLSPLPLALGALALATSAAAQSAWLPNPGQFVATPGFTYSTFDEFWVGRTKVDPLKSNDESLRQYVGYLALEYGITDRLAADVTFGYAETSSTDTFGGESDNGWIDTHVGVRFALVQETDTLPVLAIRAGGVIPGSYDENLPFSVGDGAYGFEVSLLTGKRFGTSGFGVYGDIGYRIRENPVPDDLFGTAGVFKEFDNVFTQSDSILVSAGYRHVQSLDGLDIMGPGFDPGAGSASGFPALKEINQLFEGSVGYIDRGGRHYQFTVAKSLDGRNTGDKLIFGFSIAVPLGGR